MRVFLAIDFPENVKAKLFHEIETLSNKNLFTGNITSKGNFHLTLKFFGNVSESDILDIKKKLSLLNFKPFKGEAKNSGFFGDGSHIKVIWADFLSNELTNIYLEVEKMFPEFPSNIKKFSSHITLARVNSVKNKEELIEKIKKLNFRNLSFEVNEIVLMKSELMRDGPKYKVLEKFKLK